MGIIEDWELEAREHKEAQRSVFQMSRHKPRKPQWQKSPHRGNMTARPMATTFKYRNTTAATILRFMLEKEQVPKNISQILRFGLEGMENMILEQREDLAVLSETEAIQWLERYGVSPGKDNTSNQKRILGNLRLESALNRPLGLGGGSSQGNNSPSGDFTGVSPDQVKKAMEIYRQRTKPQVQKVDPSLVAPENKVSTGYEFPTDDGLPVGWPKPSQKAKPVLEEAEAEEKSLVLLMRDGTSKRIKIDRKNRKSALIICLNCYKSSQVVLDFEPKGYTFPSDTCTRCEGITEHIKPTPKQLMEMSSGGISWQDVVQNPGEKVSSSVPLEEFKEQMRNPTS